VELLMDAIKKAGYTDKASGHAKSCQNLIIVMMIGIAADASRPTALLTRSEAWL
jgi:hypothetical protein